MAKSILQSRDKNCFLCGSYYCLEKHHIYFGNPNRKISEKHGFTVRLCANCHRGVPYGVHHNRCNDLWLKRQCQMAYEKTHTREEFIALIGKNYL